MQTLTLLQPDDFHIHLRDGDILATSVSHCASYCARAIVMPNLKIPVTTVAMAQDYQQRIISQIPPQRHFQPLMTLYLTDQTTPDDIILAKKSGIIFGAKFYPAGATTHSQAGVTHWRNITAVLETLQEVDLPLLVHGEVTDPHTDIFDREAFFITQVLEPVHRTFPHLRIVFEHITTQEAVDFVKASPSNIAATITVHHLLLNRNDLLAGSIRPHYYCLPVLKRAQHQEALIIAATQSQGKFFMGTDSAPHPLESKETGCGCAGIYSAPVALPLYATVFEEAGALEKLEGFCSHYGAHFYQLPLNQRTITLQKKPWRVPSHYAWGNSQVVPLYANQTLNWQIAE